MMNRVRWIASHHVRRMGGVRSRLCVCLLLVMLGSSATPASAQTLSFSTLVSFGGNQASTADLAVGDLNGDGTLDIAVLNIDQASSVYLNDGVGGFATALPFAEPTGHEGKLALGDLDNDGDLDIVVERYLEPTAIYINDGTGHIDGVRTVGVRSARNSDVAVADINGDGDLDIVVATQQQPGTIYLNDGTGGFGATTRRWGASADKPTTFVIVDADADGDSDIVTGGQNQPFALFRNDGQATFAAAERFGVARAATGLVAEDLDRDGDLDIATSSEDAGIEVFRNDGTGAFALTATLGDSGERIADLAAADIDRDGNIDIVTGSLGQQNSVYLNDGSAGFGTSTAVGESGYSTVAIAVADVNDDHALDVITANFEQTAIIYLNDGGGEETPAQRFGSTTDKIFGVANGDLDGDGDLDVVVANGGANPNRVYFNDGTGTLGDARVFGTDSLDSTSVALADLDGDGDLDIVIGNTAQPNKVYLNDGTGTFPSRGRNLGAADRDTRSIVTGDLDGDGDLDIVAGYVGVLDGTSSGTDIEPVTLFINDGTATFRETRTLDRTRTRSVALGDLDGDGDLDLVVGNLAQPSRVYLNGGSGNFTTVRMVGSTADTLPLQAIALGDTDGDGDLDIVAGNYDRQITIFQNDGAANFAGSTQFSTGPEKTRALALGDIDDDGDLDIVTGNEGQPSRMWRYDGHAAQPFPPFGRRFFGDDTTKTYAITLGDLDGDGALDTIAGNAGQASAVYLSRRDDRAWTANQAPEIHITHPVATGAAGFYSSPVVLSSTTISFTYTLRDPEGDAVRFVRAQYSTDGGGTWLPAVPTGSTQTTDLAASPAGTAHTFVWDTFASTFFGQSDNVILRIEAFPTLRVRRGAAGTYQRASVATQTFPFRARGTQIRVLRDGVPVSGATVYHLDAAQNRGAMPFANASGEPFRTNAQGYLEGSGQIGLNDKLFALFPVGGTTTKLYYTNAQVIRAGLAGFRVTGAGVQTLTVGADKPLMLVPLSVSLEWDARDDEPFMERLTRDLERTSELIFDWTNGQAALGEITIYHDRASWDSADVRVYATNSLRPNAAQGGISTELRDDPTAVGVTYAPGQVRIGAVWNRFGEATGNLGEDWPRTLAHELGHYVFFLDDDYLGLDDRGQLVPIDTCTDTAMSDPYRDDWSEFRLPGSAWEAQCGDTLANQLTGRADWETIKAFYPALRTDTPNLGPSSLPLAVTTIREVAPTEATDTIDMSQFDLAYDDATYTPGPGSRIFLYHDDRVTDLGLSDGNTVLARGARPGDRLCIYEQPRGRLGCRTLGTGADTQLPVYDRPDWKPELIVTPINSSTVSLRVSNVTSGLSLSARLFPADTSAPDAVILQEQGGAYSGTFRLPQPALEGYIQVWVNNDSSPRREAVADYALGGNPGFIRGRGGFIRGRGINGSSADGQVLLFGDGLDDTEGRFFSLQAATVVPNAPAWTTLVGKAYWLHLTTPAPDLTRASISFGYLGSAVPAGEEDGLRIYTYMDGTWNALATNLDMVHNFASAAAQGPGLYALMSSTDIALDRAGWNLFAYPIEETRPVADVLASIDGKYSTVYGYGATADNPNLWQIYDRTAPAYVNTLKTFEYGRGYWINVTEPVTLQLRGALPSTARMVVEQTASLPLPPATYYGTVSTGHPVRAGMQVTAYVNGVACGFGRLLSVDGQLVYVVNVRADADGTTGCGAAGRQITFVVGRFKMLVSRPWQGSGVWEQPLVSLQTMLPLVRTNRTTR